MFQKSVESPSFIFLYWDFKMFVICNFWPWIFEGKMLCLISEIRIFEKKEIVHIHMMWCGVMGGQRSY